MAQTMVRTEGAAMERVYPAPTTPAQLTAIVRSVVAVPGAELAVHTGSGAQARLRAGGVSEVRETERGANVVAGGWALELDAAPVQRAALVKRSREGLGLRHSEYRLLDHLSQEVLRAWRPSRETVEEQRVWRDVAAQHADAVRTVAVELTRQGSGGRISRELALRIFSDMLASKRVTFDVTTGESSAEVFPNVPLHDPHYGQGGWLLAGEPERRDAHLHVRESQMAGIRFCERTASGGTGRVSRVVRIIDGHGYALCDGWFSGEGGGEVFGEMLRKYRDEVGVEYEREVPFER